MTRPLPFRPAAVLVLSTLAALAAGPEAADAQERDTLPRPDTVFVMPPLTVTTSRLTTVGAAPGVARTRRVPGPAASPWAADLLDGVAGTFMDQASGPGGPTIVRLRGGEEVFTQVLVDGVQVNQNGGFFDFQGLALSNLEAVEVARGPQSAVHGSSAVSGVVQFHTPRGRPGAPTVEVRGEGGDAVDRGGSWRLTGRVDGGTDRFRYSAGAGAAYARGIFELPHDTETRDGSARLDWAAAPGWELTAHGRRIEVASHLPVRDPGATRVPLDPNAFNERDRTVASLVVRHAPAAGWNAWARVNRYEEDFVFLDENDGVQLPDDAGFFLFDADLRFTSALRRTGVETGVRRSGARWEGLVGAVVEREELEDRISGDFASDPVILDRGSVAAFGEVAWRPRTDLTVGGGVRVEKFEDIATETSPRVSASWWPAPGVELRAVAGQAYKAPNLQQQYVDNPFIVANPELRPERSTSVEAGVAWAPAGAPARGGLTVFRQTYDDLIRTVAQEGDSRQINRNLGESSVVGVEWDGALRLAGPWWAETEGAWLRSEVLDNAGLSAAEYPVGEPLPFRPGGVGSLGLAYRTGVLEGRVAARRYGSQVVLSERFSGRRVEVDGYTLVDVRGAWRVRPGVRLYARIENLFDTEYQTGFDRRGMPATGTLGLDLSF